MSQRCSLETYFLLCAFPKPPISSHTETLQLAMEEADNFLFKMQLAPSIFLEMYRCSELLVWLAREMYTKRKMVVY